MSASQVPQDDSQKKLLREFHEKSLKGLEEQKKKDLRAKQAHKEVHRAFEEHQTEALHATEKQEEQRKKQVKQWRVTEKLRKEEIAKDKKRRADKTAHVEEERRQEHEAVEKQHKFFESFRAVAAKKAVQERQKYHRDQELKGELLLLERKAYEAKLKADSDELRMKNDIEKESLQRRDLIARESRDLEQRLYGEEMRQKAPFQSLGPAGKARLDELAKEMRKKRAELLADEQRRQREREQETIKRKNEAESQTRRHKAEIDRDLAMKKAAIEQEREHL